MITEETHTCSEHYGQGGRKSGKWDVAQAAGVARSEERAGPPRWEERAKETREGAERGIFDCSMPVFFFFLSQHAKPDQLLRSGEKKKSSEEQNNVGRREGRGRGREGL